jgi:hypothetical protein
MTDTPLNPRAAATLLMDECDNDVDRAKARARVRLAEPQYEALRTVLWHAAIDLEIEQLWRSGRDVRKRELEHGPVLVGTPGRQPAMRPKAGPAVLVKGETSTPNPAMIGALTRSVAGMLHFEMPGGTMLADWTKRNLLEHGRKVIANGRASMRTGAFFIAVAEMLPKDDSRVGDVLVEADVERLYRQQALLTA